MQFNFTETVMSVSPGPLLKWLTMLLMLAGLVWWVERRIGFAELLRPWARFPVVELVLLVLLAPLPVRLPRPCSASRATLPMRS